MGPPIRASGMIASLAFSICGSIPGIAIATPPLDRIQRTTSSCVVVGFWPHTPTIVHP
ncbi:hypothetical protein [Nakamurella sp.]|uniref:hypothetical protein n=1 Tax=Nakamurella sp. TaxID=1869182 RepID=UPI003B3B46F9